MSDKAKPFLDMAERVSRLLDGDFAGALIIVPPGDAEPIVMLNVDPSQNAAHFWNAAKNRVEIAFAEFMEAMRGANDPWGQRRR